MKTVRRLYFYAVALISLEVVLWGLINLLRSIIDQTVGGGAEALAQRTRAHPRRLANFSLSLAVGTTRSHHAMRKKKHPACAQYFFTRF